MVADGGHGGVITSDSTGLLKAWDGQSGQEMSFYSSASPQCTLLPYSMEGSSFLSVSTQTANHVWLVARLISDWHIIHHIFTFHQVGTSQGSVHTLTSPSLSKLSTLVVCDTFKVNLLLASPDKKWILAGTTENMDMSPKVIVTIDMFVYNNYYGSQKSWKVVMFRLCSNVYCVVWLAGVVQSECDVSLWEGGSSVPVSACLRLQCCCLPALPAGQTGHGPLQEQLTLKHASQQGPLCVRHHHKKDQIEDRDPG